MIFAFSIVPLILGLSLAARAGDASPQEGGHSPPGATNANAPEARKVYYGSNSRARAGVWLKDGVNPPEFLYAVRMVPIVKTDSGHADIGERPNLLAASMVLDSNRIALVVNNRIHRDAHFVFVIVRRDKDGQWNVEKEFSVLEKREYEIKVDPRAVGRVIMAKSEMGKVRIECPVEGIGIVTGEDGKRRFADTGVRMLVEEVDITK